MATARDQVMRLLALVPYLQRGHDLSLRDIAEHFQVKPAQIVKDLKVLWMCGLPGLEGGSLIDIDFESFENDPDGVVRLDNADYLTKPMRLNSTQAAALTTALRTLRDGSTGEVVPIIDSVLTKIETATNEAGPAVIGASGASTDATIVEWKSHLAAAIADNHQVELAYYVPARDEIADRRVEPQALIERDGHSYLDAWCHAAGAQRLFRLDRIERLTVLDDVRSRPVSDASLASDLFVASPAHTLVTIHVGQRARWAADYYPIESSTEAADGGLDITMRVADRQWLFRILLAMAPDGTLVSPADWADDFAQRVAQTRALYASENTA